MEFYQELFLTAIISVLFAFLLGKIAGGGNSDGERPEHALASSYLPSSAEKLRIQADEDFQAAGAGFGTGEQLHGSEREIAQVEERGGGIDLVQGSIEEKNALRDVFEEDEEIYEKITEMADIDRYSADDLNDKEEREDEEESEADSSSSDLKLVRNQESGIGSGRGEDVSTENKGESLLHGEDEWEGIERSELEKRFGVASKYSVSPSGSEALARLSSDVQMELYGLHKIATEGPCYESQPLPLKISARARWQAWQKLGRMTPEVAMEKYICLLSRSIPGSVLENSGEDVKLNMVADIPEKRTLNTGYPDLGSSLQIQRSPAAQMKFESQDSDVIDSATGGLKVLEQGLTGTFLLNLLFPTRGLFS